MFKNYFKIFKRLKRFKFKFKSKYKFKKIIDLNFKKNFLNQNSIFKVNNNLFYKPYIYVKTRTSIFNYYNIFFKTSPNKLIKINKNFLKKKLKTQSINKITKYDKIIKKNKIIINFKINKIINLSKYFPIYLMKIKKLNRRVKKINI